MNNENNSKYMNTEHKPSTQKSGLLDSKTPFNTDMKAYESKYNEFNMDMYYEDEHDQEDMMIEEETGNYVTPDEFIVDQQHIFTSDDILNMPNNVDVNFLYGLKQQDIQVDCDKLEEIYSEAYIENSNIYSEEYLASLDNKLSQKGISGGNFGSLLQSQLKKVSKSNQFNNEQLNATPQQIPTPSYIKGI